MDCKVYFIPKHVVRDNSREQWEEFRSWLQNNGFLVGDAGQYVFAHTKTCVIFGKTVELAWTSCYNLPKNANQINSIQDFMREYRN